MKSWMVFVLLVILISTCGAQSVTAERNLTFGTMLPGVNRTIPTTSSSAGRFLISAKASKQYRITFNISDYLTLSGYTIPVTYTTTINSSVNDADPATTFDPRSGTTYVGNRAYVRVGGTVSPAHLQHAGAYSATVIIMVQYTGA